MRNSEELQSAVQVFQKPGVEPAGAHHHAGVRHTRDAADTAEGGAAGNRLVVLLERAGERRYVPAVSKQRGGLPGGRPRVRARGGGASTTGWGGGGPLHASC